MIRALLIISLGMAGGVNTLYAEENLPNPMHQPLVKQQLNCSHWQADKLLTQSDPALPDFLKGNPSCLQDLKKVEFAPKQTMKEYWDMYTRFNEIYAQLDDTKSRVEFTLGFITEVSKIHQVGITKSIHGRYALQFGIKLNGKINTAIMFITSHENDGYQLTEKDYLDFGDSVVNTAALESRINYVIHGKKNSINQDKMASDAEDEIKEVDDYQDWAQEQAMATCELMGCEWHWSGNILGESYINFSLEYEPGFFDFWEGYHYYP